MRIAVIGPGAIGGTLAAWLASVASNDVVLCVRTPFDRLVVEVPGGRTLAPALRVARSPDEAPAGVDWVVAVTKTYDTAGARSWLERLVGPTTGVAIVQNGVEHRERFAGLVPDERALPVVIDLSAERSAPGCVRQRRHGRVVVPACDLGARFAALLGGTPLTPELSRDFTTEAWRKLVLNAAGVVSALAARPAGVVRNDKAQALVRGIALEAIHVGRSVGATLEPAHADEVLARLLATSPDAVSSILADRLAGRPTEVDARNGVVVRLGAQHGIDTPLNAMAVAILEAATAMRPGTVAPST